MKFLGHPIHPILIVFPLGLLSTAAVFDTLYLLTANTALPTVSIYLVAAGVITGTRAPIKMPQAH